MKKPNVILSLDELENIARKNLSNFEGEENYEGVDEFEGDDAFEGDDFVQYDGINLAKSGGKTYTINIVNANAAARTVVLSPGISGTTVGLMKTGAFTDKAAAVGLSGSGSPQPLEILTEFTRRNALRINTIQITSSDPSQILQQMLVQQETPFGVMESKIINLAAHVSPSDTKDKMVIVPAKDYALQFDDQTRVELLIPGLASTVITLYTGPILNNAGALAKKVNRAMRGGRRSRK